MHDMKVLIAAVAALTLTAGSAFAGEGCGGCCGGAKAGAAVVKDPVSGKVVQTTASAPKSTYKGKTYYFVDAGSKAKFDKAPAKYVAAAPAKPTNS
jgi:YHS domain-containing protein